MKVPIFLISLLLAFAILDANGKAAELKSVMGKDGKFSILINGEITPGDNEKLIILVKEINGRGKLVSGVRLNSPGGNLLEGLNLALSVKSAQLITVVARGAVCASACFLVFAGGAEKYAHYLAKIGVHGASDENGNESFGAKAATVGTARIAKEFGVPASIIGKMVTTPPDYIFWLSVEDLRSMGTTMVGKPDQTQGLGQAGQISRLDASRMQLKSGDFKFLKADPTQIVEFLQIEGYSAKLGSDKDGDPMIESASQGAKWEIYFYGCSQRLNCQSIQFSAGFNLEGKGTLAQANEWNMKYRFTSVVLDKNGNFVIRMDAQFGPGMPTELVKIYMTSWDYQLGLFLAFIGFK